MNFLSYLPEIERIACYHFRRHHDREEMVDRVRTRMWERWTELEREGTLTDHFVRMQLSFTIRAVKCGRRLEGSTRLGTDALDHKVDEEIRDEINGSDDLDPVGTVVAKDLYQTYQGTLKERERRMLDWMIEGASNPELVQEFKVSQGRISQFRRLFHTGMSNL
ncbi:MAG TPA: hypothetical protein VFT74_10955 [Isosphaeraceae bacterium]|nr:hypothetical protein [Isosphaeraceae bacterium]